MFDFFKKKICKVCGRVGNDILVLEGKKSESYFCRTHLLEKFEASFLNFPHRMVVFHPEQDRKHCGTMYPFYPVNDMVSKFYFQNDDAVVIKKCLTEINGFCRQCKEMDSHIAYFRKGILKWDGGGSLIKGVTEIPESLCNKCTYGKIEQDLRNNKQNYVDNGLLTPYKEEGVFVNTYL